MVMTKERVRGGPTPPQKSTLYDWSEKPPPDRTRVFDKRTVSERLSSWPRMPSAGQPYDKDVVIRSSFKKGSKVYHNGRIGRVLKADSLYWKDYGVKPNADQTLVLFEPDMLPTVVEKSALVLHMKYGRDK